MNYVIEGQGALVNAKGEETPLKVCYLLFRGNSIP